MMNTQMAPPLTYPTPAMQSLIDNLRSDIRFMRQWFDASPERDPIAITVVTPATVLCALDAIVESVEPNLRFYLNYPTQRLSVFLIKLVDNAESGVCWLGSNRSVSRDPSLSAEMYQHSCERLYESLRDWHNAIDCAGILRFDADTPEIQH